MQVSFYNIIKLKYSFFILLITGCSYYNQYSSHMENQKDNSLLFSKKKLNSSKITNFFNSYNQKNSNLNNDNSKILNKKNNNLSLKKNLNMDY